MRPAHTAAVRSPRRAATTVQPWARKRRYRRRQRRVGRRRVSPAGGVEDDGEGGRGRVRGWIRVSVRNETGSRRRRRRSAVASWPDIAQGVEQAGEVGSASASMLANVSSTVAVSAPLWRALAEPTTRVTSRWLASRCVAMLATALIAHSRLSVSRGSGLPSSRAGAASMCAPVRLSRTSTAWPCHGRSSWRTIRLPDFAVVRQ